MPRGSIVVTRAAGVGEGTLNITILAVDTSLSWLDYFALPSTIAGRWGQHPEVSRKESPYRHATHAVGGRMMMSVPRIDFPGSIEKLERDCCAYNDATTFCDSCLRRFGPGERISETSLGSISSYLWARYAQHVSRASSE